MIAEIVLYFIFSFYESGKSLMILVYILYILLTTYVFKYINKCNCMTYKDAIHICEIQWNTVRSRLTREQMIQMNQKNKWKCIFLYKLFFLQFIFTF